MPPPEMAAAGRARYGTGTPLVEGLRIQQWPGTGPDLATAGVGREQPKRPAGQAKVVSRAALPGRPESESAHVDLQG